MDSKIKKLLLLGTVWLALAAVFALIGSRLFRTPYDRLVIHGRRTEGWVTLKEPDNHQNVHYTFIVNSQTYTGIGHGRQGGLPDFEQVQVGQKVPVVYDPADPNVSSMGDPGKLLRSGNFLTIAIAITFPAFILAALWVKGVWRFS